MATRYLCGDEERRNAVDGSPLNGVDFLEVMDAEAPTEALRQTLLVLRCLKPVTGLTAGHLKIAGGERLRNLSVLWAFPLDASAGDLAGLTAAEQGFFATFRAGQPGRDHFLVLRSDSSGDRSTYRLVLSEPGTAGLPPAGFDVRLSSIEFSFKVECPSDFDCRQEHSCEPAPDEPPPIDYLAKDYGSFRRLLLDRMAALAPEWQERNPADLGVALVELLAYTADRLSYFQDAVATEAYLGTARQRISLRRHARLVGYGVHEGVNARTWALVAADPAADGLTLPGPDPVAGTPGTLFATRFAPGGAARKTEEIPLALARRATFFESLHPLNLHSALDRLELYTWSNRECCLPAGATEATLRSAPIPGLVAGSFLLFEEVLGPRTGQASDADPAHRHVVRLTRADSDTDRLDGTPIIHLAWDGADALPFPLCISSRTDEAHGKRLIEGVSVARGNLVLVDHGRTLDDEILAEVPDGEPYRPRLAEPGLTHAAPLPASFSPVGPGQSAAAGLLDFSAREALPAVRLSRAGQTWQPRRDLLASDRFQTEFVVEMDDAGAAHLRFGDGVHGARPIAGPGFTARYRVGQGRGGNIGAEALAHVFVDQPGILAVRNPLAARGGEEPEAAEEVRQKAPQAFRVQQRAVTEADYAEVAQRHPQVQRAAATFRWTGSWTTVFLTVDRFGGLPVDAAFERELRAFLERFRMAGQDLEVDAPRFVSLELAFQVCVHPDYFRSDIHRALLQTFSNRRLADGRLGFFHPDRWTFGQPLYLSQLFEAAAATEGVASVDVTSFQRLGRPAVPQELADGVLAVDRLEILRLDNDPNFQENGKVAFQIGGGR